VDLISEGGRTLFQERLALLGKLGLAIIALFYALGRLAPLDLLGREWLPEVSYLGSLAVFGATWLICHRGERSLRTLRAVDAGAMLLICLAWAAPALVDDRNRDLQYLMLLGTGDLLILRAVFIPTSSRHTALVSLVAITPVVAVAGAVYSLVATVWAALACLGGAAIATVASHVIYGLRQEVRTARQLGQYTLEEKLGEGGMGVVYRASHAMLRRPTAVKLLPPEKAGEAGLRRFEREVQLTALLSHPNTIAIFDYGHTADGVFYYAMEYLEGLNLERLVSEHGPQPAARVVHVMRQVCGTLTEAHGVGLIHRDVKPANVILCERGGIPDVAKVVDFGLVKDLEHADGLSKVELIAGTPLYLAPEAITSGELDARSDLYALGAVGYYLLAGRNVFEGRTVVEVCSHHLHTLPVLPSERLGRPLPPMLEALILSCLEKDPGRRPRSARELDQALAACEDVGEWTEQDARDWWARQKVQSRPPRESEEAAAISATPTLSVSLANRLGRPVGGLPRSES